MLKKSYSNFQKLSVLPCNEVCCTAHTLTINILQKCTILRKTEAMNNFCEGTLKSLELFRKEVDKRRHDKNIKWNYSQSRNKKQNTSLENVSFLLELKTQTAIS